jgi:hypothetical protein
MGQTEALYGAQSAVDFDPRQKVFGTEAASGGLSFEAQRPVCSKSVTEPPRSGTIENFFRNEVFGNRPGPMITGQKQLQLKYPFGFSPGFVIGYGKVRNHLVTLNLD